MSLTRKPSGLARSFAASAAIIAAALWAGAAIAQDQPAAAGQEQPAAPATNVTQPDWEKVCGNINDQQECHVSRRRLAATGQPIAQLMIIERGDKKLVQVAVPPVALIQPGLQLKIDEGEATGVKYVVCTPGECLALGEINDDYIAKMKSGGTLYIAMLNPQGKPVNFDISLAGFTAAYDGPGLDPAEAQARQQKLEDELKRKADEARQQLLQLQQQQTTTQ